MVYKKKIFKIVFVIVFLFVVPKSVFAATLSINPASGTYKVGDVFSVNINVSSYTDSMNAVSGTLSYPKNSLSIISVSKNNSILTTWLPPGVTGPTYNTSNGTIHFEGVLIGGYKGGPKTVFTVNFKVKKSGTAKLSFKNGTVLANDGMGTNLTESLTSASYKLAAVTNSTVVGSIKNKKTTPTKTISPVKIAEKPVEKTVVVNIPEPVVASSPAVTQAPVVQKSFYDYYSIAIISGFGILIILILMLFIKVTKLTRLVKQLQTKKTTTVRRKTAGFSAQKVSVKGKQSNPMIFRGIGIK